MSDITTFSQFFYGHTISNGAGGGLGNNIINFDEGSGELTAELNQGDYTLEEFVLEIKRAMDAVGTLAYNVSVDRTTRQITISSDSAFDLLVISGSQVGTSPWALMGFTGADRTGLSSYEGDSSSGSVYRPQAIVFDYVSIDDFRTKQDAVVNTSASGKIQTVQFGDVGFIEMNISPISSRTNLNNKTGNFEESATGVEDARDFLNYLITKAKVEFMEDRDTPSNFTKCLLESTQTSRQGTAFRLESIIKGFYQTGRLRFREAIDL